MADICVDDEDHNYPLNGAFSRSSHISLVEIVVDRALPQVPDLLMHFVAAGQRTCMSTSRCILTLGVRLRGQRQNW